MIMITSDNRKQWPMLNLSMLNRPVKEL